MKLLHTQKNIKNLYILILFLAPGLFSFFAQSQTPLFPRDSILAAARDIMQSNQYCALVTVDSTGQSQVRTMNPFPLGDELVIWFATNRSSRKVSEIKNDPRVSVYYADHNHAIGYVNLIGKAEIIDDKKLLVKKKREYWEKYIPDWKEVFVLIKIVPESIDVIHYSKGITGEPGTNRSPQITF
ncbi:MAG: pyridoxamine 5'-phosphate oxidase family protein [Bacteroidales bacterium]|nr:pyridoxamine 5'-phosphate oxidase family protein [Bacteroidales bacterium]